MDLTSLISSLSSMGVTQIIAIGAVLLTLGILWLNWRSLKKRADERERLANEVNTYRRLSEVLQSRKEAYEDLMDKMRKDKSS